MGGGGGGGEGEGESRGGGKDREESLKVNETFLFGVIRLSGEFGIKDTVLVFQA